MNNQALEHPMLKTCNECSARLVDVAKFCKDCGAQQQQAEDSVQGQGYSSARENIASDEPSPTVSISFLEHIPNWLRWVLAYPLAIMVVLLVNRLGTLAFRSLADPRTIQSATEWNRWVVSNFLVQAIPLGLIGYVFVRISAEVAPFHRRVVSTVSTCLVLLATGMFFGIYIMLPEVQDSLIPAHIILEDLSIFTAGFVGAMIAMVQIHIKKPQRADIFTKLQTKHLNKSKPLQEEGAVRSAWEKSIVNDIRQSYPLLAIETNNRTVIPSRKYSSKYLEIDIWIPELRLGIEANGLKWHDKEAYDRDRQHGTSYSNEMYKENFCNSKNIVLLHVWGNESPDEIHNRISSAIEAQKSNPNVVPYVDAKEAIKDKLRVAAIASVVIYFLLVITAVFPISNFSDIVIGYAIVFALCYFGYSIFLKIKKP